MVRFKDRTHAGEALARRLVEVMAGPCVVGAIPRGGVVVGLPVATALGAPLVVVNAHKLTASISPEFAFGAIDEDGESLLDEVSVRDLGLEPAEIERARARAWDLMRARIDRRPTPSLASWLPRRVVLVDDGLATGLTMRAAVRHARRHGATAITVAVPCASAEAAAAMRLEAEHFVCPVVDPAFMAVGCYYDDFSQVSDSMMAALLEGAGGQAGATGRGTEAGP